MAVGTRPTVGLDIGTSAVRAAQVASSRSGRSLLRFAQVALSPGAVVDGEVRNAGPVSEAVAQLWKRAKLGPKRAILGIANQRVVVRRIELPYLEEKEFRASVQYQVADHIPMSIEDAELDVRILQDYETEHGHLMRVLVIAAATDMVEGFISAVTAAGVEPVGVDLTPLAATRAISPVARGESGLPGAEAIVDVGAGVTSIVVHHGGEPAFVRILMLGGDDATDALATLLDVPYEEAEAAKLDLARGLAVRGAERLLERHVDSLVAEIRGSLDYFLGQEESEPLASVVVTGGGALVPGLLERLEQTLDVEVARGDALSDLDIGKSGLTEQQVEQVGPVAAAAVGLSMGASKP